ncbi:MAG: MATE family efflux transporter [Prevotellaceae bacterium]|jgi:MATE family multidrug resistance protein|nr:MATE family efflux transporter [Prevotellaceae bacterium]
MRFTERYTGHYRPLITLGIPIVIGQLGQVFLGFIDTLMIGHYGTNELAAASFVNSIMALLILISTGFSFGLTPIIGALYGQGKHAEAGGAMKNGMNANLLVGAALTVVMGVLYFFLEDLGQPEELIPLIKPYFLIQLASLFFVAITNACKQFTDSLTYTRISMWILLSGNALNVLGNWLLIYGEWGFPEWGLIGAGVSTMASRIIMAAVFILILIGQRRFSVYRKGYRQARCSMFEFRRFNALGWPVAMQMGLEACAFNLCAVMAGWLGTIALASHQVMITISTLPFMINAGLSSAVAIRVSYFRGQNDWRNVQRSAYAGAHLVLCLVVIETLLLILFLRPLFGLFTEDAAVIGTLTSLMLPFLLYQLPDSLQVCFSNALRGIADVKPMMRIAVVAYLVISLPLAYVFGFITEWGLFGIWLAFPFSLTVAAFLFWQRFNRKTNKQLG